MKDIVYFFGKIIWPQQRQNDEKSKHLLSQHLKGDKLKKRSKKGANDMSNCEGKAGRNNQSREGRSVKLSLRYGRQ